MIVITIAAPDALGFIFTNTIAPISALCLSSYFPSIHYFLEERVRQGLFRRNAFVGVVLQQTAG